MVMRAELATAPDSAAAAVAPAPFAHGRNEDGRRNRGLNENSRISSYDRSASLQRRLTWNRSSPVLSGILSAARSAVAIWFEVSQYWLPVERLPARRRTSISRPPASIT